MGGSQPGRLQGLTGGSLSQGPLEGGPAALPRDAAFRNQGRSGYCVQCGVQVWAEPGAPLVAGRVQLGGLFLVSFQWPAVLVKCWAQQAGSVTLVAVRPPLQGWGGCGFEGIFLLPGQLCAAVLHGLGLPVSAAWGRPLSQPVSRFLVGGWVFRTCWGTGVTAQAVFPVPDPGKASSAGGQRCLPRVQVGPGQVQAGVLSTPCGLLACIALAPFGTWSRAGPAQTRAQQTWLGLSSQKPGGPHRRRRTADSVRRFQSWGPQ